MLSWTRARKGPVILYEARDEGHTNTVLLAELLRE